MLAVSRGHVAVLKSLRRIFLLRRRPELDPRWQTREGAPEAQPLPEDLFWLVASVVDLKVDAWERAKPRISDYFWRNLGRADTDLRALLSYRYDPMRRLANDGIRLIAARMIQERRDGSDTDLHPALSVLKALSTHDDWGVRMTVTECLPSLLPVQDLRESVLEIAAARVSDDSYYVAEKATALLTDTAEVSDWLIRLLAGGTESARSMVLRSVRKLADDRREAVTDELVKATAQLLSCSEGITSYLATKTLLKLMEGLPDRAAAIERYLTEDMAVLFPKLIDQFDGEGFSRAGVAAQAAALCRTQAIGCQLLVASLDDRRSPVREGVARVLCALGESAVESRVALEERMRSESDWSALVWAAAAWEAVSGRPLPEDRWPVVPAIWQMVFYLMENQDSIPVGVRFEPSNPLCGLLKREQETFYLYWPANHGVTSSDRLLDDYMPLTLEDLSDDAASGVLGKEVEITGTYRDHKLSVDTLGPRRPRKFAA